MEFANDTYRDNIWQYASIGTFVLVAQGSLTNVDYAVSSISDLADLELISQRHMDAAMRSAASYRLMEWRAYLFNQLKHAGLTVDNVTRDGVTPSGFDWPRCPSPIFSVIAFFQMKSPYESFHNVEQNETVVE